MGYGDRVKSSAIRIYLSTHELAGPVTALVHVNFARKAVASRNMSVCADVAAEPVQVEAPWLNLLAFSNILVIEVTFVVFQFPIG